MRDLVLDAGALLVRSSKSLGRQGTQEGIVYRQILDVACHLGTSAPPIRGVIRIFFSIYHENRAENPSKYLMKEMWSQIYASVVVGNNSQNHGWKHRISLNIRHKHINTSTCKNAHL